VSMFATCFLETLRDSSVSGQHMKPASKVLDCGRGSLNENSLVADGAVMPDALGCHCLRSSGGHICHD
jgi:hypothetical protein